MISTLKKLLPYCCLIFAVLGCGLFSNNESGGEVIYAATEVGTPQGEKITKEIGPDGGTLASTDGRMTLRVPAGALTDTIPFSIQPISNKAGNGIGTAYRLEPDGKTFTTPLEIMVRFTEKDLEGTVPEVLSLAYQDKEGAWHAQESANLDQDAKTLTTLTTHFTDFAFLARLRIHPTETSIYVGNNALIELFECKGKTLMEKILSRPSARCSSAPPGSAKWELLGEGTLKENHPGVLYTAPSKKPTPNEAFVVLRVEFEFRNPNTGELTKETRSFSSRITILDHGFRVTGQDLPTYYSGTVCSLEKPFKVTGNNGPLTYNYEFTPSANGRSGTGRMTGEHLGVSWKGSGPYTVVGFNSDRPTILFDVKTTASIPQMGASGSGVATIELIPLETNECAGK